MIVTATEFKTNFGKYLDLLLSEDIFITRNGKTILLFGITLLTPEELIELYQS